MYGGKLQFVRKSRMPAQTKAAPARGAACAYCCGWQYVRSAPVVGPVVERAVPVAFSKRDDAALGPDLPLPGLGELRGPGALLAGGEPVHAAVDGGVVRAVAAVVRRVLVHVAEGAVDVQQVQAVGRFLDVEGRR